MEFKLNSKGLVELMQGDKMRAVVSEAASKVASKAASMSGGPYDTSTGNGKDRAYGRVTCADKATRKDTLENNTLLKALESVNV